MTFKLALVILHPMLADPLRLYFADYRIQSTEGRVDIDIVAAASYHCYVIGQDCSNGVI